MATRNSTGAARPVLAAVNPAVAADQPDGFIDCSGHACLVAVKEGEPEVLATMSGLLSDAADGSLAAAEYMLFEKDGEGDSVMHAMGAIAAARVCLQLAAVLRRTQA